jgi:hypothetical protein
VRVLPEPNEWTSGLRSSYPGCVCGPRSGRVPRPSLDAPENLPEQARRQVALGKLQDEVPGMPDQASAGFEEPLLETGQGSALDGKGESESVQEIPKVVRDNPKSSRTSLARKR